MKTNEIFKAIFGTGQQPETDYAAVLFMPEGVLKVRVTFEPTTPVKDAIISDKKD